MLSRKVLLTTSAIVAAGTVSLGAGTALAATSYPTSLSEVAPQAITFGRHAVVSGRLTLQGTSLGLGPELVSLYRRPVGTMAWTFIRSAVTNAHGDVAFSVAPTSAQQYELRHAADGATAASASGVDTVSLRYAVAAGLAKSRVAPRASDLLSVAVNPNAVGAPVVLQGEVNGMWLTMASKKLSSTSRITFTLTAPTKAGVYHYRVLKGASSAYIAATSPTLILNVT